MFTPLRVFIEHKSIYLSGAAPHTLHLDAASYIQVQPQTSAVHKATLNTPLGLRWRSLQQQVIEDWERVSFTFPSWDLNHQLLIPRLRFLPWRGGGGLFWLDAEHERLIDQRQMNQQFEGFIVLKSFFFLFNLFLIHLIHAFVGPASPNGRICSFPVSVIALSTESH